MTKYLTFAFVAVSLAASQAAVTINLSGSPTTGPQFTVPGGALIPDGSTVRLGTFDAVPTAGATFAQLAASFQEFGKIATGSGTDNVSGANTGRIQRSNIAGGADAASPQPDSFFASKPVYIWVYSGASAETAAQGVFGSATTFKDQATAVSVSMGSFVSAFGTFADGGAPASATLNAGAATAYRLAAPIPEPSASILALLGIGLLSRRKR
jgi:hypothetical protein